MSTTPEDPPIGDVEEDLEGPQTDQPATTRGLGGILPRFRESPRATNRPVTELHPPSPPQSPGAGPEGPSSAGATGRSSRTSTDDDDLELVDPADLKAAVGQVVDITFVSFGQALGLLEKRAKDLPAVDERWMPTREERKFVLEPAGRIAKRHIRAPAAAMDTIDGCIIASGVGGFAMRAYLGIEAIQGEASS